MAVAVARQQKPVSVERLVDRVLGEISSGVLERVAIEHVLAGATLDEEATSVLLHTGLGSFVRAAKVSQRFGESYRLRFSQPVEIAPADGSGESDRANGGGSVSRITSRRTQQVAPGKPTEWLRYENLTRIPYKNTEGIDVPLIGFGVADWRRLYDRENTTERNAAARKGVAAMALRYCEQRKVDKTSDLPAKDLAALDVAVAEAWRR